MSEVNIDQGLIKWTFLKILKNFLEMGYGLLVTEKNIVELGLVLFLEKRAIFP